MEESHEMNLMLLGRLKNNDKIIYGFWKKSRKKSLDQLLTKLLKIPEWNLKKSHDEGELDEKFSIIHCIQ